MPALPEGTRYGTLTWQVIRAVGDTAQDPDRDPDATAIAGLTAVFTPTVSVMKDATVPVTIFANPITATFDNQGFMVGEDGQRGVRLIATDSPNLQPQGVQYKVVLSAPTISSQTLTVEVWADQTTDLTNAVVPSAGNRTRLATVIPTADPTLLPPSTLEGDLVLAQDTSQLYRLTDAALVPIANLRGEKGDTGDITPQAAQALADTVQARDDATSARNDAQSAAETATTMAGQTVALQDAAVQSLIVDEASATRAALELAADGRVRAAFAPMREVFLADFGARFDRRALTVSTSAGSTAVTSDGTFTAEDVGVVVFIPGAGPAGTPYYGTLITTLASVESSSDATLSQAATVGVVEASGFIGTNNDPAWDAAFAALGSQGGTVRMPAGHGLFATQKTVPDNVRIVGAGRDVSVMHPMGSVNGFYRVGSTAAPIRNVHFADFTIDGDMQTNGDGAGAKGFGMYFQQGCTYTDVRVRNTAGSGFGNDAHQDCWYTRCIAEGNGRIGTTSSPGHSGFGFGTGGWEVENLYLVHCVARANMRHGAFFEFQPSDSTDPNRQVKGVQVIGGLYTGNGLTGISDQNCQGITILGAHIIDNVGQGFSVSTTSAVHSIARDGLLAGCVIQGNGSDGVDLAWIHQQDLPSYGQYRIFANLVADNAGHGIQARSSATFMPTDVEIGLNTVRGNARNGIRLAGGPMKRARVQANSCLDNGQAGASGSEKAGIAIQCTLTDSEIVGNLATDTRDSAKTQAYGILIDSTGMVDGYSLIADNRVYGNSTDQLGGTARSSAPAIMRDNLGVDSSTMTPMTGSSPLSHTAGARPERHYISGGTVTQINIAGNNLIPSGSVSSVIQLDVMPGETITVTWSAAPAWKYRNL